MFLRQLRSRQASEYLHTPSAVVVQSLIILLKDFNIHFDSEQTVGSNPYQFNYEWMLDNREPRLVIPSADALPCFIGVSALFLWHLVPCPCSDPVPAKLNSTCDVSNLSHRPKPLTAHTADYRSKMRELKQSPGSTTPSTDTGDMRSVHF
jgi:hypothetical protein